MSLDETILSLGEHIRRQFLSVATNVGLFRRVFVTLNVGVESTVNTFTQHVLAPNWKKFKKILTQLQQLPKNMLAVNLDSIDGDHVHDHRHSTSSSIQF